MKYKAKALVVDDEPTWLEIFTELLQELDIEVVNATNYNDAITQINQNYFHLIVSDVRLVDEDDNNTQGLEIISYINEIGLGDVVTKIVITGYGTVLMSRQSFKEYGVFDFISKKGPDGKGFSEDDFKQTITSALHKKVGINTNLVIEYVHGLSLNEMVSKLERSCGDVQSEILRWELSDLIRKLFPDANSVILSPVSGGHSRSGVVKAEPIYDDKGQASALILKYGLVKEIEQEAENYNDIKRFTGGKRYTTLERKERTRLLGGIVYSLVEKTCSFNDYFPANNSASICSVLDDLFTRTCRKWYENRKPRRTRNLLELYWEPADTKYNELKACFQHMYSRYINKRHITFPHLEGKFTNPLYHDFVEDKPIYLPVHMAITHGDLHGENLLIDRDNHTWMIDFYRTGDGHIFRDIVALETTIKFQLFQEDDLKVLYQFEKCVQEPKKFTGVFDRSNFKNSEDANKAFDAIECLRNFAGRVVQPSEDMRDYYAGLFYQTLNLIRYYQILQFKQRKYYILLSAAMLCEKLENWENW